MGRHRGEPVGELGTVGVADRDATGGGEHPQYRTADVGERHIDRKSVV